MGVATMSKQKGGDPAPAGPPSDDEVTTVKARRRIAKIIRQIGSLRDINQEEVLDLFQRQFEDHLAVLLAERQADLKARPKRD